MRDIVRKFKTLPKKSIGLAGTGILVFVVIIMVVLVPKGNKDELELSKPTFEFEYGEDIVLLTSDILKTNDDEILEGARISMSFPTEKTANGEDIIKVGTYTQKVIYKGDEKEFKVKVQDTIAPEFVDFKETIEVEREYEGDLTEQFSAEDLATVTISTNTKEVDFSKAGEYKATVTATDNHNNKTTKEFTVVVSEKSKAEKEAEAKQKEEEEAKAQEEAQQTQSSSETNATNTTTPTQPQTTDTSGQSGNGGTTPPTPAPGVCTPTWKNLGNSGKGFYSYDEADAWADEITWDRSSKWYGMGWWVIQRNDTCGGIGWTIEFY